MSDNFASLDRFFTNIDFVVPGYHKSSQYMVAFHRAFYQWATNLVRSKQVLEAGCGEGFGAAILAATAASVVGIDIKPELVEHASQRYPKENLTFETMDCEAMTFEPHSFDVVVCNELLEHLPNYRAFLAGAVDVLRPGGLFICATTNAALSFHQQDGSPMNRNHYQEFAPAAYKQILAEHFGAVSLTGQRLKSKATTYLFDRRARGVEWLLVRLGIKHKIPIRWRNRVREWITGSKVQAVIAEETEFVDTDLESCLYLIGVGSKT